MNWEDEGFIISKRKFRENAIIIEVFTNNFGRVSGIVYGGNSRKIKNYLQLVNKIHVVYKSKSENKTGYFSTELIEAISAKYFNDRKKTLCINALSSILKILLPENQSQKKVYNSLNILLNNFSEKNWLKNYLEWEINLINNLGFGFEIDTKNQNLSNGKKTLSMKIDNIDYQIPLFLISEKKQDIGIDDIFNGLMFSRSLMLNKFFNPNNLKFPYSRVLLEKKIY